MTALVSFGFFAGILGLITGLAAKRVRALLVPTVVLALVLAAFVAYGIWRSRHNPGDSDSGFYVFGIALLNLVAWTIGCAVGFLLRNFRRLATPEN